MIWSTTWPQERPGFYYCYFSLVFINLRKGQNQEKKLVDVCWWRHTSLISSFHAARIPTCGCQMYRDDLFWSRCQSWNIIKKMYKKNHKKKKNPDTLPTYQYPLPSPAPYPFPLHLQRVQQQVNITIFFLLFFPGKWRNRKSLEIFLLRIPLIWSRHFFSFMIR